MKKKILETERRNLEAHVSIGATDDLLQRPEKISCAFYIQPHHPVGALESADSPERLHRGKIDPVRQAPHLDYLRIREPSQQRIERAHRDEFALAQDSQAVA